MAQKPSSYGMNETTLSTDLRAVICLGAATDRYRVVVRLGADATPTSTVDSGLGPGRLGADWRTVGLEVSAEGLASLSWEPWVERISLSHRLRGLARPLDDR